MKRSVKLWLLALAVLGALAGGMLIAGGCGEEECLVWGENCTTDYKKKNYGRTDIYCCEGQCSDHGSGILTCGS